MKNVLILISLISITCTSQSKLNKDQFSRSTISGVVTFFFNDYQGDKADLGSQVYVIDSMKVDTKDLNLLKLYLKTSSLQNQLIKLKSDFSIDSLSYASAKKYDPKNADAFYLPRIDDIKSDIEKVNNQFLKYGFRTIKEINYLDLKTKEVVDKLITIATVKKTIDGSGGYSIQLKPNKYFVLIRSNNRHSSTVTESDGNLFFQSVNAKKDWQIDVSQNFNIQ